MLSGREVDASTRRLVLAKDGLISVYLASGLGSTAAGYALSEAQDGHAPPMEMGDVAAEEASVQAHKLQRTSSILGTVNLAAGVALIGLTAVLAMKAGRSTRWSFLSSILP
jgi:hypothetical protein